MKASPPNWDPVPAPARCPLCGGPNRCRQTDTEPCKGPCWCESVSFPEALLARVPVAAERPACICRRCATEAGRSDGEFDAEGDSYVDPLTGLQVFTESWLRRRGYCCDSGCRHCPWRVAGVCASGGPAASAALLLLLALNCCGVLSGKASALVESFDTDPASRGWVAHGDSGLFSWDPAGERLAVTWDSSAPHSFFARPLGMTLGVRDAFTFGADLVVTEAVGGVRPPRTGAMQVAFGLLNLDRALQSPYARAAGRAFDVAEFNWFPEGEFPGFGVVDPTVSPALFDSTGRVATAFTFPVDLIPGALHQIRCSFDPGTRTLSTLLTTDSGEVPVRAVVLPASFGDLLLNAVAVINWNEAGSPFDSLLARGFVDNVHVELPAPPLDRITWVAPGAVSFTGTAGWYFRLEAAVRLGATWEVVAGVEGVDGPLVLADPDLIDE